MRAVVHPADAGGCGHYRLIWPTQTLQKQGARNVLLQAEAAFTANVQDLPGGGKHVHSLMTVPEADVVVLQRPLGSDLVQCIPHLQAHGIAVVVEVDDDFQSVSQRNVAWSQVHPSRSPHRNWRHLARACAMADLVTVTTPALAKRYGGHGRVAILPNYVPERYFSLTPVRPHPFGSTVAWSGSLLTHPDDLQVTRGAVARALGKQSGVQWAFHCIGGSPEVAEKLDIHPAAVSVSGWQDLASMDYPRHMAGVDVGIVPLELSAFNEAKSWLKGLEWAALGVPFVATPTHEYRALSELGAGLLADSPRKWESCLTMLMTHEAARTELAEMGRETARGLTIEKHAWRWAEAWAQAVYNRKRRLLRALN